MAQEKSGGLLVVDISNPTSPTVAGTLELSGEDANAVALTSDGAIAAVAFMRVDTEEVGVHLVDVSNPSNLSLQSILSSPLVSGVNEVAIRDGVAYLSSSDGFTTLDISDPDNPVVGTPIDPNQGGRTSDVALQGQFAFAAETNFRNVSIFDISVPDDPVLVDSLTIGTSGNGIAVDEEFIYMAGSSRLFISRYVPPEDSEGAPPTVVITNPQPGRQMTEGSFLPVTVFAVDDVSVGRVDLLVDGQAVSSDNVTPYQFNLEVPFGSDDFNLGARAVDFAGNKGEANEFVITVLDDPPPTIFFDSPEEGTTLVQGQITTVDIGASFDTTSFEVSVNGVPQVLQGNSLFNQFFLVHTGVTSLTFDVLAEDRFGQQATMTRTFNVIPDPLSTVVGTVVDSDGSPVVGADVICHGMADVTGENGSFSIQDIPTVRGSIWCVATRIQADIAVEVISAEAQDIDLRAVLLDIALQVGSVTNIGDLVAIPTATFLYPGPSFSVGDRPMSSAVADLNGDGILDGVTANWNSSDISVLLGIGDGTFLPEQRYSVIPQHSNPDFFGKPVALVVADLNADDRLDIVTASEFSTNNTSNVTSFLGNGDGTFRSPVVRLSNALHSSLAIRRDRGRHS